MPWTLDELYLTTQKGQKVSLGTLASMESTTPPKEIHHHNQMRSATLTTSLHGNLTLESAMQELLKIVNKVIPGEYKKEWIGSAREFQESASTMLLLLFLAVIFIYAILAIQFDNFIDPLIIMFTVPLGCFGALLTAYLFHQSLNIYTQIGLITLIGLITKHGILIVEFANQKRKQGLSLQHAVMEAAVLRLRPILMTTAAMILGAIPLIMAG
jgi:multidrug efflux pump